jgi:hypothetical protein
MKWIIPTRSMVGEYGHARRGVPMEVEDGVAEKLVKAGRAVIDPAKGKGAAEKKADKAADKAAGDSAKNPPKPRRSGGRTGAGKSSSVSEAGQAPDSQTSSSSEGSAQS